MIEREEDVVRNLRAKYADHFQLTERVRDFGYELVVGRQVRNPSGNALLTRVLLALYFKMLAILRGIIVLAERKLPTSSLMRELTEALISLSYILQDDSSARAELYRDYLKVRRLKDVNRRLNDPDTRDTVTPKYKAEVEAAMAEVAARRGQQFVDEMRKDWRVWAGDFTLETMAQRAGLPGTVYNLAYAADSLAAHALDAANYLTVDDQSILQPIIPEQAGQHLIPAATAILVAMDKIAGPLGLNREGEMKTLLDEALALKRK